MDEQALLESAPERIAQHRMAEAMVQVVDRAGAPVPGARVQMEQVQHAFLFGANAFPLLRAADLYAERFTDLLNYATLGFYWGGYEREPGVTQERRLREQAEWLRDHGIPAKGHPLVWHETYPKWAPVAVADTKAALRARVTQIVSEFAGLIDRWDVVNEATVSARPEHLDTGVGQWAAQEGALALVREALGWAREANPKAILLYNEFNISPEFEALMDGLLAHRAPVDVIGIQSHMHHGEWPLSRAWEVCQTYARFGLPLHFTELTVLSGEHGWMKPEDWETTPEGEARQADYVPKLYTLLFSHPAVEAITWWDLLDGEWQSAPAGLVRADLSPKPAYERLRQLVKETWWTKTEGTADAQGQVRFRGFLGRYRISAETSAGAAQTDLALSRGGDSSVTVTV